MIVLIVANPYGIHYYPYLLNALTMKRSYISEWDSILTGSISVELVFFIISLLLAGYALWKRGFENTKGIFLLLITAIVSIKSNRLLPFYAILWIYFVPSWTQTTFFGKNIDNVYRNRKFYSNWTLSYSFNFPGVQNSVQFTPWSLQVPNSKRLDWGNHVIYPVGAVEYLRLNGFKGNILVPYDWGAYIIWKLYPNVKVSLDGRYRGRISQTSF